MIFQNKIAKTYTMALTVDGNTIHIRFTNGAAYRNGKGVYRTDDPKVIKALKEHKNFDKKFYIVEDKKVEVATSAEVELKQVEVANFVEAKDFMKSVGSTMAYVSYADLQEHAKTLGYEILKK